MDMTDWNPSKYVFSSLQGQRYDRYLSLCAAPVGVERFAAAEVRYGKFTLRNRNVDYITLFSLAPLSANLPRRLPKLASPQIASATTPLVFL